MFRGRGCQQKGLGKKRKKKKKNTFKKFLCLKSWEHRDGRGVSVLRATGWGDPSPVRTPESWCGRAHPVRVNALPETARLGTRFPRAGSGRARLPEPGVQCSRGLLWPLRPSALFPACCCPCARREAEVLVSRAPGAATAEHRVRSLQPQLGSSCALRSLGAVPRSCGSRAVHMRRSPGDCLGGAILGLPGKGKRKP